MPPTGAPEPLGLSVAGLRVEAGGRVILDMPALELRAGEFVVLRGASGAGKTTALNAFAGIAPVRSGRVAWGKTDLARLGAPARRAFRRERLGLVFQDYRLFDELDALENASLAASWTPARRRAALRAQAERALNVLGLVSARRRRTAVMSGGERQRVAVARALATDPVAILADEPTASLDRTNAEALAADLAALADRRTLIVVSHDPALVGRAGRVLTLADGRIVEDSHA